MLLCLSLNTLVIGGIMRRERRFGIFLPRLSLAETYSLIQRLTEGESAYHGLRLVQCRNGSIVCWLRYGIKSAGVPRRMMLKLEATNDATLMWVELVDRPRRWTREQGLLFPHWMRGELRLLQPTIRTHLMVGSYVLISSAIWMEVKAKII